VAAALQNAGRHEGAEKLYRLALAHYGKLLAEQPGILEYRLQQVQGTLALADVLGEILRRAPEAEAVIRQLMALLGRLEKEFGDKPECRRDLARTHLYAAERLHVLAYHVNARDAAEAAARLAQKGYAALTASPQGSAEDRAGLVQAHDFVGQAFRRKGQLREAEKEYRHAMGIWEDLAAKSPETAARHSGSSRWAYFHYGELLKAAGRTAEAEKVYLKSVREDEAAIKRFPGEALSQGLKSRLGHTYRQLGFLDGGAEGEKAFRRAAELFDELAAESPGYPNYRHFQADTWKRLGWTLAALKRPKEAEQAYRKAIELHEKTLAELPRTPPYNAVELLSSFTTFAGFLTEQGRSPEAAKLLTRAQELYDKIPNLKNSTDPWSHNNVAWQLVRDGRLPLREPAFAVRLATKAVDLAPANGLILNTLGTAYYRAGDWQAAVETLRRADGLKRGSHFSHDAFVIAMAHWRLGEKDQARKWYTAALLWMEKHAPRHEELIRFRAEAAALLGFSEQLTSEQAQAVKDNAKYLSLVLEAHPGPGWAYSARAAHHRGRGEHEKADADLRRALAEYSKLLDRDPKAWLPWACRGEAAAELRQWKEAEADYARAAERAPEPAALKYLQALARLGRGDGDGHRKLCAETLARSGQAPEAAHWAAWACVLTPGAAADWARPVGLAQKALAADPRSCDRLQTLGAVLYRAGRYEQAAKRLAQAEAAFREAKAPRGTVVYCWLFQAMAQHRLGHRDEAKALLGRAAKAIDRLPPGGALPWNRRLTLQLLRKEAEQLLKK
jgi:tetratricopeptide (TPR) repeat protein